MQVKGWQSIVNTFFQQHKTLHMDITRWSIPKSDWLYSLQPKMEKLYTVTKNKTGSWLWLWNWKLLAPWKKNYDKPGQRTEKQRHHFADKGPYSQSYGFPSRHVQMWELDHKEGWVPNSWCFWIVVLENTLENLLDCKEIKPVYPKGNQFWIFIGRTDAEA